MTLLRSLAFNLLALLWTAALALACAPLLAWSRRGAAWAVRLWAAGLAWLLARVIGLGFEVRGIDRLPRGPAVVAANHQSAWETIMLHRILDDPAFVLKRELMLLPTGWYAWRAGAIPIDRAGGAAALRSLVAAARRTLARGQTIVIFPQGTRTPPGVRRRYHPGIAALYTQLGVPVVPVALNSGLYWGRKTFLKQPGTVIVEVLPAIPPGLGRAAFLHRLTDAIEGTADRLTREADGDIVKHNVNGKPPA
ncbi:MAG: lysophospholipid acyltransferase family protein [Alphaproteobacteria bacterium]